MSEKYQIPLPSREAIVGTQIQNLLNIAGGLMPYVLNPYREENGGTPKGHPELDGGLSASATLTLMAVCDKLTEIAQDKTLWTMDGQKKLEDALAEVYAENVKLLRATTYASQVAASPVVLFKPTLGKLPDGRFFAVYGDLKSSADCVLGTGNTLEEALQDYNQQFKKSASEANKITPEPILEAEVIQEPAPRKRKGGS